MSCEHYSTRPKNPTPLYLKMDTGKTFFNSVFFYIHQHIMVSSPEPYDDFEDAGKYTKGFIICGKAPKAVSQLFSIFFSTKDQQKLLGVYP